MSEQIEIIESSGPKALERCVWTFLVMFPIVYLETFLQQSRASTRHKWVTSRSYYRLSHMRNFSQQIITEPLVPMKIAEDVLFKAASLLKLKSWSDRK